MTPDEYCQHKVARNGSSFYYSLLPLSDEQRRAITALYAFCHEVAAVGDSSLAPQIAHAKLIWWQEELGRLHKGQASHPVTRALREPVVRFGLPLAKFSEVITGMEMDLEYDAYPSFTELSLYCYRVSSVAGLMAAKILGYSDRSTENYASDLGMAIQLTKILRNVRKDLDRGRLYIPLDEFKRFDIKPEELQHTHTDNRLRALLAFQAKRAHHYYERALSHLTMADRSSQRSGLIMATIYRTLLNEIERDHYRVLEHRIELTPIRKLWIAWRVVRRERRHLLKMTALM